MTRFKLDTENAGCDEILVGDSREEVLQDVLNRYEVETLPEGWTITDATNDSAELLARGDADSWSGQGD